MSPRKTASVPSVGVVLATRDRPALLAEALASVRSQEYAGVLHCAVVFDGTEPDFALAVDDPRRPVTVLRNERTPGLAGARNTGILRLCTDLVAFCDDDDAWLPGKLAAQVALLGADPTVEVCCTGIEIAHGENRVVRTAGQTRVGYEQLLASRMSSLHPSSFVLRRQPLVEGIGLVAEDLPGSYAEDWDLLLRAARRRPIGVVDEPLVRVLWGAQSYFAQRWRTIAAALEWFLAQHEDLRRNRRASALLEGKLSFAHAALGNAGKARAHAGAALRRHPGEPRAYLALLVAARVASADTVLSVLNARGRSV